MSRFSVAWRPTLEAMLLATLSACTVVGEPILGADGGSAELTSRVLVADGAGVIGFDALGQLPPFLNAVRWEGVSAAVVDSDILFVARPGDEGIGFFDDATRLDADRTPTRVLNVVEQGGPIGSVRRLRVDDNGTLWAHLGEGEVRAFFAAAERIPGGSFSAAVFADGTLTAFAYLERADVLFAGSLETNRIVVWEEALTRASLGASSFSLDDRCDASAMTLRSRLFVACRGDAIRVWNDPGTVTAGTAADTTLQASGIVNDMLVAGSALFAVGPAGVDVWRDAGVASGAPDTTIDVPGERVLLDGAGSLFVSDGTEVRVVRNALTTPEVIGAVSTERSPLDIALY